MKTLTPAELARRAAVLGVTCPRRPRAAAAQKARLNPAHR